MRHTPKKELLSIPNLMGYFRLIMTPVSVWLYLRASTDADCYRVTIIIGISPTTDMSNGVIARKFNMTTEFDKLPDLLIDRLTHRAILFCLWSRHPLILPLLILFVLREGFMLVIGIAKLGEGRKLNGVKWLGKYCTVLLFVVLLLLLFFPHAPLVTVNLLILLCVAVTLAILLLYIPVFCST